MVTLLGFCWAWLLFSVVNFLKVLVALLVCDALRWRVLQMLLILCLFIVLIGYLLWCLFVSLSYLISLGWFVLVTCGLLVL